MAQSGVKSLPKDPVAHIALGTAWWGKKENAKAEAAFKEAVRSAPADAPVPAVALLEFYAGTGQKKLAREMLEPMLHKSGLPEVDRDLLRGYCLARFGDREAAKEAYRKAVEVSKEDPAVQMRLAEFLLGSSEQADQDEAERLLRGIMTQHDPARRRLAEVLVARGGEAEWEEAQKLLELSAGDSGANVDRFAQARSLLNRGGPENLAKAAAICQALTEKSKQPMPGVRLLLARILERQDNLEDAREQYRAGVRPGASVPYPIGGLCRFPAAARTGRGGRPTPQTAREAPAGEPGHGATAGPLASRPEAQRRDRTARGGRRPEAHGAGRQEKPRARGPGRPGHRRSL